MSKRYRCVKTTAPELFTEGKIYELDSENRVRDNSGFRFTRGEYANSFEWLERNHSYKFEEVTDTFIKDDLKTGMIAQTRNGAYWLVLRDTGCADCNEDGMVQIGDPHKDSFIKLSRFDETLGYIGSSNAYDIMKVVAPRYYPYVNEPAEDMENGKLLFNRDDAEKRTKLTVEEIEKRLGYKIAIVDEEGK